MLMSDANNPPSWIWPFQTNCLYLPSISTIYRMGLQKHLLAVKQYNNADRSFLDKPSERFSFRQVQGPLVGLSNRGNRGFPTDRISQRCPPLYLAPYRGLKVYEGASTFSVSRKSPPSTVASLLRQALQQAQGPLSTRITSLRSPKPHHRGP